MPIVVGTSTELFVNQIYLDVLLRPAEQAGLESWTTQIADGVSRQKVVRLILGSSEARALVQQAASSSAAGSRTPYLTPNSSYQYKVERINDFYQAILGRPADPAGLQFFIGVVNQGLGGKEVKIALLSSDEYYSNVTNLS